MATNVPAATFPAPAVTTADGLELVPDPAEDPVEEAEETEVSVVLVTLVDDGFVTPVAVVAAAVVSALSVVPGSAAEVSGTVDAALLGVEEASEMVGEAEVRELEAAAAVVTAAAAELAELEMELEVELELPDASILNGNEYWKVLGSESRVIFSPYVA